MPKANSVFINCPFDFGYQSLFDAMVFAVYDCGFKPRCALELDDAGQVRVEKIYRLIFDCQFGIHDISRTELDATTKLPRFNMPFELGLFLGARRFGSKKQSRKISLILDKEPFRFQKFISDIAGQDIRSHYGKPERIVRVIRDWLQTASRKSLKPIASGEIIFERYKSFRAELPIACGKAKLDVKSLTFADYRWLVESWLRVNA